MDPAPVALAPAAANGNGTKRFQWGVASVAIALGLAVFAQAAIVITICMGKLPADAASVVKDTLTHFGSLDFAILTGLFGLTKPQGG